MIDVESGVIETQDVLMRCDAPGCSNRISRHYERNMFDELESDFPMPSTVRGEAHTSGWTTDFSGVTPRDFCPSHSGLMPV